ncbi:MAG: winged helix-turn-helix domain-containing protein [Aeromonadaceae bacterium]
MKRILIGNMCFYPFGRVIEYMSPEAGEKRSKLSEAEARILEHLLENTGEYFSKEHLISIGWNGRPVSSNSLPVAIGNIRKLQYEDFFSITNLTKVGYALILKDGVSIEINSEIESVDIDPVGSDFNATETGRGGVLRSDDIVGQAVRNAKEAGETRLNIFLGVLFFFDVVIGIFFLYLYTDIINITCDINNGKGFCYTNTPPDNVDWNRNANTQILAKSGSVEVWFFGDEK